MRANTLKSLIDSFNHESMDAPLRSVIDPTIVWEIFPSRDRRLGA
jgi:hypothetical protein